MFGNGRCHTIKWSPPPLPPPPTVHLLQTLVLPVVKSPVLEPVCALPAAARPKLGVAAAVRLGTATAEMSLYRSVSFIFHTRMFVPQEFRLRPASDSG